MHTYDPESTIQDADLEMAAMDTAGDAIARAQRRGVCTHGGVTGWLPQPVYGIQHELAPGELACWYCPRIFASSQDWYDAMDAAVEDHEVVEPSEREFAARARAAERQRQRQEQTP